MPVRTVNAIWLTPRMVTLTSAPSLRRLLMTTTSSGETSARPVASFMTRGSSLSTCQRSPEARGCSFSTALVRRRRRGQMPQLVWIAHHVQRPNDVALNLERGSLHRSLGSVDDDTGQAVDRRKAHREVVAPPRTCAFARGLNQEPRRAIAAVDHLQRRPHLAAAV